MCNQNIISNKFNLILTTTLSSYMLVCLSLVTNLPKTNICGQGWRLQDLSIVSYL
jgi:hypothetical protein